MKKSRKEMEAMMKDLKARQAHLKRVIPELEKLVVDQQAKAAAAKGRGAPPGPRTGTFKAGSVDAKHTGMFKAGSVGASNSAGWTADKRGVKGSAEAKTGLQKATQKLVKEIERLSKGEMTSKRFGKVFKHYLTIDGRQRSIQVGLQTFINNNIKFWGTSKLKFS